MIIQRDSLHNVTDSTRILLMVFPKNPSENSPNNCPRILKVPRILSRIPRSFSENYSRNSRIRSPIKFSKDLSTDAFVLVYLYKSSTNFSFKVLHTFFKDSSSFPNFVSRPRSLTCTYATYDYSTKSRVKVN